MAWVNIYVHGVPLITSLCSIMPGIFIPGVSEVCVYFVVALPSTLLGVFHWAADDGK
jgi:hypothetical protein